MAGRKSRSTAVGRSDFAALLADVKDRIQAAQTRAVLAVNAELVRLYWDIGRIIIERQRHEGWGAAVIPRLARELHNELPHLKGFSERNIKLMVQLASEYPDAFASPDSIGQPAVAQLPGGPKGQLPVAQIPWAHNVLLMQKVKDFPTRRWYMEQTITNGWSRNVLALQIDARAHARHGEAASNFAALLPAPQSDLAQQTLKDPYIFDFLTLTVRVDASAAGAAALCAADGGGDRGGVVGEPAAPGEGGEEETVNGIEGATLDAAITANLKKLGYGG